MSSFIGPLVRESTPSIIADKLRQAIAHGELKPGAQLGEAELARKLGVSRGPLREGMQRLTQEGLLVSIRNRGLFVIDMTADDVRDMYFAREAIEQAAARKIIAQGNHRAAGKELLTIVDQMAAAQSPSEVSEIDIAFHERLLQLADSPRLSRMHQTFITETRMFIHALDESYAKSEVREKEHRSLANAIRKGDRELVDRLLAAHMEDAVNRLTFDTSVDGEDPGK
ncbi:GntR family transcriptional regulator [Mycolicibacterium agri]|uniref:GntR family transcriptional regulator n=1 Tax=Mycolicibacterium agri TaxID=36811 RepID=A0A2A7MZJ9_MYCAG|nr:GntR family transcriptional regulator [Mycolicibacterium agri]PEG37076.1 GntR family transcriptional regulator [Mycolicibacterium agri]GFG52086.1 GntR family transcriptional regulator [Mycolicibacterium agri]